MGKIFVLNQDDYSRELLTNKTFAKVTESKKPESANSGLILNKLDSAHQINESKQNGTHYNTSILPDVPNLYKHNGMPMQNSGYFIIPRSVTSDPRYKSARLKYQKVLHVIFEKVAFAPTTHAIGNHLININIGQLCVSEDHLVKLCNEGVKYKEDKVNGSLVHRAIKFWSLCGFVNQQVNHKKNILTISVPEFYDMYKKKIESRPNHNRTKKDEFVNQEVNHGKTLLTISAPEFYDRLKKTSETTSEPKVNQKRTTKEEDIIKNEYHPSIPSYKKNSTESDLIDDFSSQIEKIEIIPGVSMSKSDLELCIKIKGSLEAVKTAVESIQNNKKRKRTIVDWPNALLSWKDLNPIQNNAKENILYSKDLYKRFETFKDGSGWRCRHYKSRLKDDQGLLFENESPYIQTYFVSYGDYDFVKKCKNFIQDNFKGVI